MNRIRGQIFARRLMLAALAALLVAQAAPPASLDDLPLGTSAAAQSSARTTDNSPGPWLVRTLGALAGVIALVVLARVVLARTARRGAAGGSRLVELLARPCIAPRTHILFLRINQRIIVASQTPNGISPLVTLDDPGDVEWVLSQTRSRGFASVLGKYEADHAAAEVDEKITGLLGRIRAAKRKGDGP